MSNDADVVFEPFASVEDLEVRWRELSDTEKRTAAELLLDASAYLRQLDPSIDARIARGHLQRRVVTSVVCDMVKRALMSTDTGAITQQSETVGVFSASATYFNPSGDMYLTKTEKRLLGLGAKVRNVRFGRMSKE
jgi:hypothetical protein